MQTYKFIYFFSLLLCFSCYKTPVTTYEEYVTDHYEETQSYIQNQNKTPQSDHINFTPKSKEYLLHTGLYFGLIFMILLVNFFFYLNLKDSLFLYYIALVCSVNITLAYHEGLLYPWIKNTLFQYDWDILLHISNIVTGFVFMSHFLNPKKHYPKLYAVLKYLLFTQPFIYLGYFLKEDYFWLSIANGYGILYLGSFWVISFFFWKKEPVSKYASFAFGLVVLVAIIHIIFDGFYIPILGHTTNLLKLSIVLETLILTYAATTKTRQILEENRIIRRELEYYIQQNIQVHKPETETKISDLGQKYGLTERELDVLLELTKKSSNSDIAEKLFISVNTVKYHVRNIYEKLDINHRNQIQHKIIRA